MDDPEQKTIRTIDESYGCITVSCADEYPEWMFPDEIPDVVDKIKQGSLSSEEIDMWKKNIMEYYEEIIVYYYDGFDGYTIEISIDDIVGVLEPGKIELALGKIGRYYIAEYISKTQSKK